MSSAAAVGTLVWLLVGLGAPAGAAPGSGQRDPFQPGTGAGEGRQPVASPIKGRVGDGERWQLWTTDERGRWLMLESMPPAGQDARAGEEIAAQRDGTS